MTQFEQNFFLHPPDKSTTRFVKWAEWLKDAPGIDYGCVMDKHIIPLHPGDLMAVVARPGHGKSSWMAYMARRTAQKIIERGDKNKCVIYVSWEQSVEEIEAFFQSGDQYSSTDLAWGRADLETVKRQAIKRINLPIWLVGKSIADADKRKPPMTIEQVYNAIRDMRYKYDYEPILVCLDYLQIIPVKNARDRMQEVTEATYQAKDLAIDIAAGVIAGVQARRETDNHKDQMPTMGDAQWTSAIEQVADKQISIARPIRFMDAGEPIQLGDKAYTVDEYLMLIRLLKQRFDVGYGVWPVHFEPQTLTISDYASIDFTQAAT